MRTYEEQLMQEVRSNKAGTYAKARAWVAYMREYRRMQKHHNEPRREFADMQRRHLKWPLSMRVAVKTPQGYLEGHVIKHLRESPGKCLVSFEPHLVDYDHTGHMTYSAFVPFRNIKKIDPK